MKKSLPVAGLALISLCYTNTSFACTKSDFAKEIIPLYENVEANVKGAIFGYDQAYYLANFAKQVKERSINCQIYSNNSYFISQLKEVSRSADNLENSANKFLSLSGKSINDAKNNLSKEDYGFFDMLALLYQGSINSTELENTRKLVINDTKLLVEKINNIFD